MADQPKNRFADARTSLQDTVKRLETLRTQPLSPPADTGKIGKIVGGDIRVTTSEEELIEALAETRATTGAERAQRTEILFDYIEQLLRDGELKFTHSQTHGVKVR